jgi:hypothetical protein
VSDPDQDVKGPTQVEWDAALEDAGYTRDDAHLILVDRERIPNANMAEHHEPNVEIHPTDLLDGDDLDEANAPDVRNRHRVAIWMPPAADPVNLALVSAKLRHELEHARQWDTVGEDIFRLSQFADRVLWEIYDGAPGSAYYYNQKPIEIDANSVASKLILSRFPPEVVAAVRQHDEGRSYREFVEAADPQALVRRTLQFVRQYPDAAQIQGAFGPVDRFLRREFGDETAAIWATLANNQ